MNVVWSMENENLLKMLWHAGYWDQPLNGLAEYHGEKVYFEIDSQDFIYKPDYPPEVTEVIRQHKITKELELLSSLDDYEIFYDDEEGFFEDDDARYTVREDTFYKIYQVPDALMRAYEDRNVDFSEMVGYHCWHDPSKYKPFVPGASFTEYYAKKKTPIEGFDVKNFKCLGRYKYNKFQWYQRPWL